MGAKELGIFAAVLVVWLVLNRWVLPWLGVSTCMGGPCRPRREMEEPEPLTFSSPYAEPEGAADTVNQQQK